MLSICNFHACVQSMLDMQIGAIDLMAMTVAVAVATSKPLQKMIHAKPAQVVNDKKGRTILLVVIVFHAVTMAVAMAVLSHQSWYKDDSYNSRQVTFPASVLYGTLQQETCKNGAAVRIVLCCAALCLTAL